MGGGFQTIDIDNIKGDSAIYMCVERVCNSDSLVQNVMNVCEMNDMVYVNSRKR